MADETTITPLAQNQIDTPPAPAADKPLDTLKANEQAIETKPADPVSPEVARAIVSMAQIRHPGAEPQPAEQRLRAFEDREFGEDAVRINDRIERGYGSKFRNMADKWPRKAVEYAALEQLIVTEQALADAETKYLQAGVDHDAALAAVAEAEHGSGE